MNFDPHCPTCVARVEAAPADREKTPVCHFKCPDRSKAGKHK